MKVLSPLPSITAVLQRALHIGGSSSQTANGGGDEETILPNESDIDDMFFNDALFCPQTIR
jgi:hypothetical protein